MQIKQIVSVVNVIYNDLLIHKLRSRLVSEKSIFLIFQFSLKFTSPAISELQRDQQYFITYVR